MGFLVWIDRKYPEKFSMMARLPEIAYFSAELFEREAKVVLPQDYVLKYVAEFTTERLSADELLEHYHLLSDYIPGWIANFDVNGISYMELCPSIDIDEVLNVLQVGSNKLEQAFAVHVDDDDDEEDE